MDFDHKNPDYQAVFEARLEVIKRIKANLGEIGPLKKYYADKPSEFINDFGCTFDPRNAEIELPAVIPFLLFDKQKQYIDWLYAHWRGRNDGLVEKSRDMGVSWLCVAFAVWMWLFHAGTVVGFGSRKQVYVDEIGDPKSLFHKIRQFIDFLPREFWPAGFDLTTHANFMKIINPENGSSIIGEAGDSIGRGARASIYFIDEAAFLERPELADAALSQTSNCRIYVSTPNGNGNPFYRKRHSGKIDVFTFNWRDDPRKDDKWYAKQLEILDPVVVAQEINIDYNASTNDSFIPGETVAAAQGFGPADVQAVGKWIIGVDAAHMGDDESVIHLRRGRLNRPQIIRRQLDGPVLAGLIIDTADELAEVGGVGAIIIELDGPGVSAYDNLKSSKYGNIVIGVHTGARLSDGKNYNRKAKMWRAARDYLSSPPVSLPRDPELLSQLSAVKYKYKDGALLMQSKVEYKKDSGGRSPDRADAFVLTFADIDNKIWEAPEVDPYKRRDRGSWMSV